MKIIVTGGAGFIGSHLVDNLYDLGHEIVVLDNFSTGRKENLTHLDKKITLIECDLSIPGQWQKSFEDVDTVYHLAALADVVPSIQKPLDYFKSNVDGTFNVLQAAREYNVSKIIYSASSSCYGLAENFPTSEKEKIDTQYPYALTKRLGEELVLHWAKVYKIRSVSLRFFNVYGPRARTSGTYGAVFGVFLKQKLSNAPFTVVGDGNQTRDFTYVSDVVDACISVLDLEILSEIFNVGSGKTVSVNQIADLIGGKDYKRSFIPKRPGEPDCTFADISNIKSKTSWYPKIDIEVGVKNVLKEIDYWKEAPLWTPDNIAIQTEDWFKYLKK